MAKDWDLNDLKEGGEPLPWTLPLRVTGPGRRHGTIP